MTKQNNELETACVRVRQVVDTPSDHEDFEELNLGRDGVADFDTPDSLTDASADEVLDWFHDNVAIGCLDDYDIEVIRRTR